ncbi:MAG: sigma-70 family RNA polymerase sigma factor [Gammaproteobacteria bacterium]|nr:sigma-70 family RNA polymerase sigma factor [Gammaproteobacteria bacterium]
MDRDVAQLVALARIELPYRTAAFERLAAHCYPRIRRLARAITGSRDDADTVAQETMLKVFHGLPALREPARFDAWLQRTLVNTANSHLAAERRQREKARVWRQRIGTELQARSDAESTSLETASFDALIEGLNLRDRSILAFRLVEELDYPAIAHIMGMGESAVKMAYRRAIERLRQRHQDLV